MCYSLSNNMVAWCQPVLFFSLNELLLLGCIIALGASCCDRRISMQEDDFPPTGLTEWAV